MPFGLALPENLTWKTRPHDAGEPARHVAELTDVLGATQVRANLWRYDPGARGKRHRHAVQEETFVVLSGTLTIYIGEPAERVDVPVGGVVTVPDGVELQIANHAGEDLLVYAHGFPPDHGAVVLDPVV